ncbi:hypothetical protein GKE82_24385 [Conexibacter sp. W3-3-2]|uniref:hypothetical protein n=1 Tax=Conexibacter sp. W3-3-2 TaxID=2675227 RepID=UPI0012B87DC9|nr:hypothetical protein [Conexibacter sp. W3-3-2]MTD47348.1 hypothetical protein [Conexibacter sp. W3-3-2]
MIDRMGTGRAAVLATLLLSAMPLAGCGDSDTPTTTVVQTVERTVTASTPEPTATPTPTPTPTPEAAVPDVPGVERITGPAADAQTEARREEIAAALATALLKAKGPWRPMVTAYGTGDPNSEFDTDPYVLLDIAPPESDEGAQEYRARGREACRALDRPVERALDDEVATLIARTSMGEGIENTLINPIASC